MAARGSWGGEFEDWTISFPPHVISCSSRSRSHSMSSLESFSSTMSSSNVIITRKTSAKIGLGNSGSAQVPPTPVQVPPAPKIKQEEGEKEPIPEASDEVEVISIDGATMEDVKLTASGHADVPFMRWNKKKKIINPKIMSRLESIKGVPPHMIDVIVMRAWCAKIGISGQGSKKNDEVVFAIIDVKLNPPKPKEKITSHSVNRKPSVVSQGSATKRKPDSVAAFNSESKRKNEAIEHSLYVDESVKLESFLSNHRDKRRKLFSEAVESLGVSKSKVKKQFAHYKNKLNCLPTVVENTEESKEDEEDDNLSVGSNCSIFNEIIFIDEAIERGKAKVERVERKLFTLEKA